ncbi:MAG: ATP-dependent RNA helicase HrpA [Steroidobacteraceae bacterium]
MGRGETGRGLKARLDALAADLDRCMLRDRRRLAGWRNRLARAGGGASIEELERLAAQVAASIARCDARRATLPAIRWDESLPVHARRTEIADAIRVHPVVIVSGAAGSGKSTQLPKICLELGRGAAGLIGHTQPRRIAAQALAHRVAEEVGTATGDLVGYQVRFTDRTGPRTLVKLMTDGLLLRELESDPLLERYDTLILDEAHERNLNVDFLLGVVKRILPRRPELRVVVTSATIETDRFAQYFGAAPVIDVEGRSHPVEMRWRPLHEEDDEAPSLPEAVVAALDELATDARGIDGDALVFLPGERQIAECRDLLARTRAREWDVLPLFARLSAAEQDRIFAPHPMRRAVLATNVAETSITIPGVRFVVDSGLARISRYSPRTKFQRLPVEPVSQASADQRAGRCGRVGEGICIRLYAEDDYAARSRYTDPEILRTNLASLILQMAALGLGAPEEFPFLDAPDTRLLNDGYRLLQELGAVDGDRRITRLGRRMAGLPVDPRLARVLIEAARLRCLAEGLVVAAFLSIQDPRERPAEQSELASERHAAFADERSDFVAVLNLWRASRERAAAGTGALRRWCRENFLSFVRMREWSDLHDQLAGITGSLELERNAEAAPASALHQAILSGFLGGIGVLDEDRTYLGARDSRFVIAPGTPLARRTPRWVVAASLVETHRLYARMVAQVQPSWIEVAGAHLVKRAYGDAQWDPGRGMVVARETVSLYGRMLSGGRQVNFADVDAATARRIFVEEALVRGQSSLDHGFLRRNAEARRRVEHVEAKLRRRDLLAHDDVLAAFYLERIPADVATTRAFDRWWRGAEREFPRRLDMDEAVLLAQPLPAGTDRDWPDRWPLDGNELPLEYVFDPTSPLDGVSLRVPLPLVPMLPADRVEWLVPGLLREKVIALLRGLPRELRRELVPIPDAADRFLGGLASPGEGSLHAALAAFVSRSAGRATAVDAIASVAIPDWLRLRIVVVDAAGHEVRASRDLRDLRRDLRTTAAANGAAPRHADWHRDDVRRWDFGPLPEFVNVASGGVNLRLFPVIVDAGTAVNLRLEADATAAHAATRGGIVRLAALAMPQQREWVLRSASADRELALLAAAAGAGRALYAELADRAVEEALLASGASWPHDAASLDAAVEAARGGVAERGDDLLRLARNTLAAHRELRAALEGLSGAAHTSARTGLERHAAALLAPGWLRRTPHPWLRQLPKYLKAAARRAVRLRHDVERDRRLEEQVRPYEAAIVALSAERAGRPPGPAAAQLGWMVEEFRVSLHAQELRTLVPVSARRLDEQIEAARAELHDPLAAGRVAARR